ncbi:hypothetical protein BWR15_28515 [Pseudomonas sp. T]|nr:hypothetical protein BWR15_28515 [Pseudomonas sp. T]
MAGESRHSLVSPTLYPNAVTAMKKNQPPLRSQRQHRGWPLDYDVLCWIGAIALILLFFGVDQFFVSKLPGTGVIEHQRSVPRRLDLPAAQALATVNHNRQ